MKQFDFSLLYNETISINFIFFFQENDNLPDNILETKVRTISNEDCIAWTQNNGTSLAIQARLNFSIPLGINEPVLCTIGILNEERTDLCPGKAGVYSVGLINNI